MVTFYVARAGESFAEVALFSDVYTDNAVAEVASRVAIYPKRLLLSALREHPNLAEDFMTLLVRKIHALKFRLELRDIRSAHQRVLQYLRHLAQPDSEMSVDLDQPLGEIALRSWPHPGNTIASSSAVGARGCDRSLPAHHHPTQFISGLIQIIYLVEII